MAEKASRKVVPVTLAAEDEEGVADVDAVGGGVVVVRVGVVVVSCCRVGAGTSKGRSRCQVFTPREI